jgi:hypothetical protein
MECDGDRVAIAPCPHGLNPQGLLVISGLIVAIAAGLVGKHRIGRFSRLA